MVEIKEKFVISYNGGPECTIPQNLITKKENGVHKFLKLRPSSAALAKVICGGCRVKNPTFTHSTKLKELKDMFSTALQAAAKQHDDNLCADLFCEEEASSAGGKETIAKVDLSKCPPTIQLDLNGSQITCLTPTSGKESDVCVCVALEEAQLEAVNEFLRTDCTTLDQDRKGITPRLGLMPKGKGLRLPAIAK